MMSHPIATPAPRYAVEDVEELMTCAASLLAAVGDGTLELSKTLPSGQHEAVQLFDRVELVLNRMREAALAAIGNVAPSTLPPMTRAAVRIDLPIDFGLELVAVVCSEEFQDLCRIYDQTPADVLSGFVADACGVDDGSIGYCTGGSDERDQAAGYIERRYGYVRYARQAA